MIQGNAGGGNGNTLTNITSYSNGVGVQIEGGGGNTLSGGNIGYNPSPNAGNQAIPSPFGNKGHGVLILGGSRNTISRIVSSGNGLAGVAIVNPIDRNPATRPTANIVQDSVLGLDPTKQSQAGNLYGVFTQDAASTLIQRNTIGGNGRFGIYLQQSDGARVVDNVVGVSDSGHKGKNPGANLDGAYATGNYGDGVFVSDTPNVLISGNAIAGNAYPVKKKDQVYVNPPYSPANSRRIFRQSFLGNGIHLSGEKTRQTQILNNRIGLTRAGVQKANQAFAILVDTGATYRTIAGNQFRTSDYAREITVYDLTKLGKKA
ncbi:MAG: right-handed parallel beta-helix repeat-containing protein [Isosphaeraceae bacterium]